MKQIIINALLIGALAFSFASCTEITPADNNGNENGSGVRTEKIGVQLETSTKVTLSGEPAIFQWTEGDLIAVWKGTSATSGGYQNCEVSNHAINVSLAANESRFNYAVYPASASSSVSYGQSKLAVNLPSTYTYSQVCDDNTPLPMIAVNNNGNDKLTFYNVGALLRLTISGIPTDDGVYLKVDFNGKDVYGSFTVTNPSSTEPYIGPGSTGNYDKITITSLGGRSEVIVNIPIPKGSYKDIIVSAWKIDNANYVPVKAQVLPFSSISRAHGKRMDVPLTLGVFSGANKKYFVFSPGNLRASTTNGKADNPTWTWAFAPNQYDYLGNNHDALKAYPAIKQLALSNTGSVDLFGWNGASSSNDSYGINPSTNSADYGNQKGESIKTEWGSFQISSSTGKFASNTWRTPVTDFEYALKDRTVNNSLGNDVRFTMAKLNFDNGHNGLIVFPDSYNQPNDVSISGAVYNAASDYTATINSLTDWQKMEAAGAVFLPAAGYRNAAGGFAEKEIAGNYWVNRTLSGSGTTEYAYTMAFYKTQFYYDALDFREEGKSVRLIRDIK